MLILIFAYAFKLTKLKKRFTMSSGNMMRIINTVYNTSVISKISYHTLNYGVLLTQGYQLL